MHNLPVQLTSFVGREKEVADVCRLLTGERLITLTGVGGCGKTRLALEAAALVVDQFQHGVWWVDLAGWADPELVPQALGKALDIREQPGQPLVATVTNALRHRQALLVFDNCEHLAAACAGLIEHLLRSCESLTVLATSQHALGIGGEIAWQVPPMAVPDADTSLSDLAHIESIRLFCERARAVHKEFALTGENAADITRICRDLDGLPLAIELAAARVRALPPRELAARLDDRLRILTSNTRTGLPRHQTLRATIEWSYNLLDDPERLLLRRLAVFPADFSLAAAEAVCAGGEVERDDVLDLLTRLLDKSLIEMREVNGLGRCRLLSTIRQFALECLDDAGEAGEFQRRHAEFFAQMAESAEPQVTGEQRVSALMLLDREHDNLRVALRWSFNAAETDPGALDIHLRLVGALWWFWFYRGHWREAREWLEGARSLARGAGRPDALARFLSRAGILAWIQGDLRIARRRLESGVAMFRDLQDASELAFALGFLNQVELAEGNIEAAIRLGEESAEIYRQLGSRWGSGLALASLSDIARLQGDYKRAYRLSQQGVALLRQTRDRWALSMPLRSLAMAAAAMGNYSEARTLIQESLKLANELGEKWFISRCLEELASVSCIEGEYIRAARLFGAAEALRESIGADVIPASRAAYESTVSAVRRAMDPEAFERAWSAGRALPLDAAVKEALHAAWDGGPDLAPLTRREREVAVLVSRGLTNREIAGELFIAEGTVANHVKRILRKLGFNSRAQIAAWVTERFAQAALVD